MSTAAVDPDGETVDDVAPATVRRIWSGILPRTPVETVVGVLAVAFLAGAIGYFVGVWTENDAPSGDSVEVGFLYDMTAHHLQAVQLATIELANGEDPAVQGFAREILASQSREVGIMEMRLGTWGFDPADPPEVAMAWMGMSATSDTMPGMASANEIEALVDAQGAQADALFVALMRDHHAGGVAMARAAAAETSDEWVENLATRMAATQAGEIVEMDRARARSGLPQDPPGFTADLLTDESQPSS
jgi:uncharacterized protein (DUF305 family)